MTVNSSNLINPDGRVAIITSLHYFFILYYDMMFYCRKRTHFLPPSLTILRLGELDILGVQDSKIGVYETIINKFSDLISKLLRIRDIMPNDLEILCDNIDMICGLSNFGAGE